MTPFIDVILVLLSFSGGRTAADGRCDRLRRTRLQVEHRAKLTSVAVDDRSVQVMDQPVRVTGLADVEGGRDVRSTSNLAAARW